MSKRQFRNILLFAGAFLAAKVITYLAFGAWLLWKGY